MFVTVLVLRHGFFHIHKKNQITMSTAQIHSFMVYAKNRRKARIGNRRMARINDLLGDCIGIDMDAAGPPLGLRGGFGGSIDFRS